MVTPSSITDLIVSLVSCTLKTETNDEIYFKGNCCRGDVLHP